MTVKMAATQWPPEGETPSRDHVLMNVIIRWQKVNNGREPGSVSYLQPCPGAVADVSGGIWCRKAIITTASWICKRRRRHASCNPLAGKRSMFAPWFLWFFIQKGCCCILWPLVIIPLQPCNGRSNFAITGVKGHLTENKDTVELAVLVIRHLIKYSISCAVVFRWFWNFINDTNKSTDNSTTNFIQIRSSAELDGAN